MAGNIFPTQKVVRGNLTKPTKDKFAGRYHGDLPVYIEVTADIGSEPRRDDVGEIVYKHYNNGRKKVEMVPVVRGYIEREYVIVDLGNGNTKKNFYFHPSATDLVKVEAEEKANPAAILAFMERTNRIFAKLGISPEDAAELAGEDPPAAADDAP